MLLSCRVEPGGLTGALSELLEPWRQPMAGHDPGRVMLDTAVVLALG
ncbi:hypothetical protein BZL30_2260 [Mycobacterium kansasii]|uniref:Transposase DDE domain-containing protein n=1 Tax=Mycobacterium kansasii TaxID=1768 RepID=A0A1V3XH37_MYCKA|nr:hypothetical protein BZL30_2260 [Mycobacterium kansasii]